MARNSTPQISGPQVDRDDPPSVPGSLNPFSKSILSGVLIGAATIGGLFVKAAREESKLLDPDTAPPLKSGIDLRAQYKLDEFLKSGGLITFQNFPFEQEVPSNFLNHPVYYHARNCPDGIEGPIALPLLAEICFSRFITPEVPAEQSKDVVIRGIDCFGNSYCYSSVMDESTIAETLQIWPAAPPGKSCWTPVPLDLTTIGLGTVEGLVWTRSAISEIISGDTFRMYSAISQEQMSSRFPGALEALQAGCARAGELFGTTSQPGIKRIFLIDGDKETANANGQVPSGVTIFDEMLGVIDPAVLVIHELTHLYDDQLQLSSGRISDLFTNLKSNPSGLKFLVAVSESKMFPAGRGGHAVANPMEMFASLVTSLDSPLWAKGLPHMSAEMRGHYQDSLRVLGDILSQHEQAERFTLLIELVNSRMTELSNF